MTAERRGRPAERQARKSGHRRGPVAARGREARDYRSYTLLFALVASLCFAPFVLFGKSFVWTAGVDGLNQHYLALMYEGLWLRDAVRSLLAGQPALRLWDVSLGYGSDVVTTLSYYVLGDPLNLLSALVPARHTEQLFCALVVARLWLAGAAFVLYCHRRRSCGAGVVCAALGYAFCGYALFAGVRHPFFLNPLIYLPLLLCGVERIFEGQGPLPFVAAVFLAALSNFYFFYMLALAVALYAVVRFFAFEHRRLGQDLVLTGLRMLGLGLLGFACAGVFVVPTLLELVGSSRATTPLVHDALYPLAYYVQLIPSLFAIGNANLGFWRTLGFAGPVLLGLVSACARPRKERATVVELALLTGLLLIPAAGSVLNGFSYVTNRWCFAFAFFVCWTLVGQWNALFDGCLATPATRRRLATIRAVLLVAFGVALCLKAAPVASLFSLCCLFAALAVVGAPPAATRPSPRHRRRAESSVVALTCLAISCNALMLYGVWGDNYLSAFLDRGKAYEVVTDTPYAQVRDLFAQASDSTHPFARLETTASTWVPSDDERPTVEPQGQILLDNTSCLTGVSSTQYYWSLADPAVSTHLIDLELSNFLTQQYRGLDRRAQPLALAGVQYLWVNPTCGPQAVPAGFAPAEAVANLWVNANALPFGYSYDRYLTRSAYDELATAQRQEALMQAAVVDDEVAAQLPAGLIPATPTFASRTLACELACEGDVTPLGGLDVAGLQGGTVTVSFAGEPRCETYLHVTGSSFEPKGRLALMKACGVTRGGTSLERLSAFTRARLAYNDLLNQGSWDGRSWFLVSVADETLDVVQRTPRHTWSDGVDDFYVNLGYHDEPLDRVTITLPNDGIYHVDSLEVVCQPLDELPAQVRALSQTRLEDCWSATNQLGGTLTADDTRILTLTIPYDEAWTATVDGQGVQTFAVNNMFMGMVVGPGTHEVVLSYRAPHLHAGLATSAAGLTMAALVCGLDRRHRSKRRRRVAGLSRAATSDVQ